MKKATLNSGKIKNEGTELKILTPNKLLTRLPLFLTRIKLEKIPTD